MSSYNGRRPNVTQYLRDLNALSPQDSDNFSVDPDIALFTNTEFFDFDSGQNTDYQPQSQPVKASLDTAIAAPVAEDVGSAIDEISNMDFIGGDFNFHAEFPQSAYPAPPMNSFPENAPFQPLQPVFNGQAQAQAQPQPPVAPQPIPQASDAHKADDAKRSGSGVFEEASRVAAEDDKRRRNTAASARFRIKKKQREQALEKSAKEMSDKVSALENKVSQLETENKWLKNLLVEKNDSSENISTLWKEFTKYAAERTKARKDATKADGRS